jgi:hypothetical protein
MFQTYHTFKRLINSEYSIHKERQVVTIWVQSEANTASVPCQLQSRRFNHSINMQCFDYSVRQSVGQSVSLSDTVLHQSSIHQSNQSVNIAKAQEKTQESNALAQTASVVACCLYRRVSPDEAWGLTRNLAFPVIRFWKVFIFVCAWWLGFGSGVQTFYSLHHLCMYLYMRLNGTFLNDWTGVDCRWSTFFSTDSAHSYELLLV